MRQDIIAGLGNIYVCEALFDARLHPDHKGCDLSRAQANTLSDSIKTILSEAVTKGGSTISDFAATDGELGYFQHQFKVYDRKGMACLSKDCCGTIEKSVHQGRSTFYCSQCQI
jgi:formamidopyrimidine-DNA glycosylase